MDLIVFYWYINYQRDSIIQNLTFTIFTYILESSGLEEIPK